VREPTGEVEEVPARALADRMGDPMSRLPAGGQGPLALPAEGDAAMRVASREFPIRFRGALLGYCERFGARSTGVLRLTDDRLTFTERNGPVHEWLLSRVRAVQGSAAAVQITPAEGGLVSFGLDRDSPRRWEELLRAQLRVVWRAEGRGEIAEFQPRIRGW